MSNYLILEEESGGKSPMKLSQEVIKRRNWLLKNHSIFKFSGALHEFMLLIQTFIGKYFTKENSASNYSAFSSRLYRILITI